MKLVNSRLNLLALSSRMEKVAKSGNLTEGAQVREFTERLCAHTGKYSVVTNSAGSGLYALVAALNIKTAIVSANTFFATGAVVVEQGGKVVVADCDPTTYCLSVKTIQEAHERITASDHQVGTPAVILTHIGGAMCPDYVGIADWCGQNGYRLIEDAAHMFGAPGPVQPGDLGDGAVYSFYPTKAFPVGEGGAVVTNSQKYYELVRAFCNYGKLPGSSPVVYTGRGMNFRMDEWTAAVANTQMDRLTEIMELRESDAFSLGKVISPIRGTDTNWYKYIVDQDEADERGLKKRAGKVFAQSDQLHSINRSAFLCLKEYPGAAQVANTHACIPLGEGIYENMSTSDILKFLMEC